VVFSCHSPTHPLTLHHPSLLCDVLPLYIHAYISEKGYIVVVPRIPILSAVALFGLDLRQILPYLIAGRFRPSDEFLIHLCGVGLAQEN